MSPFSRCMNTAHLFKRPHSSQPTSWQKWLSQQSHLCDDKNKYLKSEKPLFAVLDRAEQVKYQFSIVASWTNCILYRDCMKWKNIKSSVSAVRGRALFVMGWNVSYRASLVTHGYYVIGWYYIMGLYTVFPLTNNNKNIIRQWNTYKTEHTVMLQIGLWVCLIVWQEQTWTLK